MQSEATPALRAVGGRIASDPEVPTGATGESSQRGRARFLKTRRFAAVRSFKSRPAASGTRRGAIDIRTRCRIFRKDDAAAFASV
jgi:hypothetical protein